MSIATLNGATVLSCSLHVPAWGLSWADVELDASDQLSGPVSLVVGDLTMAMTVMSGGPWQGRACYRLAGGAGGWGKPIPAKPYTNDAGVKVAYLLNEAAQACGETFDGAGSTATIGPAWTREAGPAGRQLALLAPQAWYVDELGVTRLGARPVTTYTGTGTVEKKDLALGKLVIAADAIATLVPGATVDGLVVLDVVHTVHAGKLRTTVYGARGSAASRLGSALGLVVDALTAELRYRGVWSYRVVAQSGELLDLQVERASCGLPDLQRVPVRYPAGVKATHAMGSMVLVAFVNGDPARRAVVAGDDPSSPGWAPLELDADATLVKLAGGVPVVQGVARMGDSVSAGPFTGTITGPCSLKVTCG